MNDSLLEGWTNKEFDALENGVILAQHRLLETGVFSEENLARIIDNHPDEQLSINTMGTDTNRFEWREGDRNGTPGRVLMDLVRQGRFWMNVRGLIDHHPDVAKVVNGLYDELESRTPGFLARNRSANLLISSPQALVHYHLDLPVNMLWHLQGRKRAWVYPHFDSRFAPQEVIERVCAGEYSDEIPYAPDFDKYALVYDIEPGQLLTWPQMTPHRVTNLEGLNVSLSTEHRNPRATRRINVHLANKMLRNSLGIKQPSMSVDGLTPRLKEAFARVGRKLASLRRKPAEPYTYPISFKVDSSQPMGYSLLDIPEEELVAPHLQS